MLEGVIAEQIDSVWPAVKPLIQKAIDKSQNDYSIDDVYGLLKSRDMQLWVWIEDHEVTSCLVTMIVNYPRRRVCQLPYIAGKNMKHWLAFEEVISAWAKERHCSQLEGFSRKGWLRVLGHWKPVWTTIRKDI